MSEKVNMQQVKILASLITMLLTPLEIYVPGLNFSFCFGLRVMINYSQTTLGWQLSNKLATNTACRSHGNKSNKWVQLRLFLILLSLKSLVLLRKELVLKHGLILISFEIWRQHRAMKYPTST